MNSDEWFFQSGLKSSKYLRPASWLVEVIISLDTGLPAFAVSEGCSGGRRVSERGSEIDKTPKNEPQKWYNQRRLMEWGEKLCFLVEEREG